MTADVLVVGAGLAGLTAARALVASGADVILIDKGRRPGGRCSSRQLDGETLDTGAQFFTVRSDAFAGLVDRWRSEGVRIRDWARGFARADDVAAGPSAVVTAEDDAHPRYSVAGGMNGLAAHLARDLDVRCSVHAARVERVGEGWAATARDGTTVRGRALLLTPPVPQTLALLDHGAVALPAHLDGRLRAIAYEPCLTLMLRLATAPGLPAPGAVQFAGGTVGWMADNVAKGAAGRPAVTVHAGSAYSAAHYDDPAEAVAADLLDEVRAWLAGATVTATEVFRWRYAKPVEPTQDEVLTATVDGARAVVAGDALAGAKVEGAVRSGLAAASVLSSAV